MANKTLYIMCGAAGSGKSTYIRNHARPGTSAHISRDIIRFKMVQPDERYFSREDDVYKEFCKQIHDALDCPWIEEVWADATHLTENARKKLLTEAKISTLYVNVIPVVVRPSLEKTLEQNAQRSGRENVPERVITNMYNSFEDPWDDNIEYEKVIYI